MYCPLIKDNVGCDGECKWYDKMDKQCMIQTIRNNIVDIHIRMARREEEEDE